MGSFLIIVLKIYSYIHRMSEIYEKSNIFAIIVDLFVRHEKQFKDPPRPELEKKTLAQSHV